MEYAGGDAVERRVLVDELLSKGLSVLDDGIVQIDTRTDKADVPNFTQIGVMLNPPIVMWFNPASGCTGRTDAREIAVAHWIPSLSSAEVEMKDGSIQSYLPKSDDESAESAPSAVKMDPTKLRNTKLSDVQLIDLFPYLFPEVDVRKAVCRNKLSGRFCIDPRLLFEAADFPQNPTDEQRALLRIVEEADAHRASDGTIPVKYMMPWTDETGRLFRMKCSQRVQRRLDKGVEADAVRESIEYLATLNPRNPILEDLPKWDGVSRLEDFARFSGICVPDFDEPKLKLYLRAYFDTFLYMMARRAIYGGKGQTLCPVIVGDQGDGKSSMVIALGRGDPSLKTHNAYAGTTTCRMSDTKKFRESFGRNTVILELEEAKTLTSSDIDEAKAFITRSADDFRDSYARESSEHLRYFSMIITTNKKNVLRDDTGERRFPCFWFDRERMKWKLYDDDFPESEWIDQLWAELIESVKTGVRHDMDIAYAERYGFPTDSGNVILGNYSVPVQARPLADAASSMCEDKHPMTEWLQDYLDDHYPNVGDFVSSDELFIEYSQEDLSVKKTPFAMFVKDHIGLKWVKDRHGSVRGWRRIKPSSASAIESFGE